MRGEPVELIEPTSELDTDVIAQPLCSPSTFPEHGALKLIALVDEDRDAALWSGLRRPLVSSLDHARVVIALVLPAVVPN